MASSTSKSPMPKEQNPSKPQAFDHQEDVIAHTFRCLGLEDGDNHAAADRRLPPPSPATSVPSQWLSSAAPVSDHDNSWGFRILPQEAPKQVYHDWVHVPHHESSSTNNSLGDMFWKDLLSGPARFEQTLRGEECIQKERLMYTLLTSVIPLMTDFRLYSLFHALLEACEEGAHFDTLIAVIKLDPESFIEAAFCNQGVYSISKLVRKLKRTPHAYTITKILSTRCIDLMTDFNARRVVQLCFVLFRHETNEVLYEITIAHCHYLARHKVGCRALNNCISTISGEHRSRLLDSIADIADVLCDDRYGNYVLQKVMEVNHGGVNAKILDCLRGKFVQLAQRQVGSHTVEKCMVISVTWMVSVVEEILKSPRAPLVLAEHTFGNYVVQTALRLTKGHGLTDLHNALVKSLRPHYTTLVKSPFGRNVMNAINELSLA